MPYAASIRSYAVGVRHAAYARGSPTGLKAGPLLDSSPAPDQCHSSARSEGVLLLTNRQMALDMRQLRAFRDHDDGELLAALEACLHQANHLVRCRSPSPAPAYVRPRPQSRRSPRSIRHATHHLTTCTRLCDSVVECSRSTASVAIARPYEPEACVVPLRSLSIVWHAHAWHARA